VSNNWLIFCDYPIIAAKRKRDVLDPEDMTGVAPEWVGNPFATDAFDTSGQTDTSRAFAVKSNQLFTIEFLIVRPFLISA